MDERVTAKDKLNRRERAESDQLVKDLIESIPEVKRLSKKKVNV